MKDLGRFLPYLLYIFNCFLRLPPQSNFSLRILSSFKKSTFRAITEFCRQSARLYITSHYINIPLLLYHYRQCYINLHLYLKHYECNTITIYLCRWSYAQFNSILRSDFSVSVSYSILSILISIVCYKTWPRPPRYYTDPSWREMKDIALYIKWMPYEIHSSEIYLGRGKCLWCKEMSQVVTSLYSNYRYSCCSEKATWTNNFLLSLFFYSSR